MRPASLLVALLLAASSPLPALDLADVKSRGTLRVLAVVGGSSNREFLNPSPAPGEPLGFDREILDGFAKLQRVRLEIVPIEQWDALIPALQNGKGDVIAGRFTVTESRRKLIHFTSEVFPTRHVVFTRKPHRVVDSLDELRQEKVGTVKGTSMAEVIAAAKLPPGNVDDTIRTGTLPEALREGRITAAVLGVENVMSEQRRDPSLQLGMFLGPPGSLAYGVRKEDAQLLTALNEYIDNLRRTPTWNRLVVSYFGERALDILKRARGE
jgi:ABC-type amino acid transport substrate-binding protein